jgi:hypothetical protein
VKQETSQHMGHFGVFFRVTTFTVMPSDRPNLRTLHFCASKGESWKVSNFVTDIYDRMLAQGRPCEMMVAISNPLTRKQAELFNDQNDAITVAITAVAAAAVPSSNKWAKATSGFFGGASAFFGLDSRHAGDLVVSVQAWVNGGIGPQHTSAAMLIKNQGGSR